MKKADIGLLEIFRGLKTSKNFKELKIEGDIHRCIVYIKYKEYAEDLKEVRKIEDYLFNVFEGVHGLDKIYKSRMGEICIIIDEIGNK